jgi:hypothetical protein
MTVNYNTSLINFTEKQMAKATPPVMQTWLESRLSGVHVRQQISYLELG